MNLDLPKSAPEIKPEGVKISKVSQERLKREPASSKKSKGLNAVDFDRVFRSKFESF